MKNSASFIKGHPYYPSAKGKGRKQSPEHIRKRSEAMIGKNKNKKRSLELRKKLSVAFKGSKSSLWKGGVYPENKLIRDGIEYRLWREAVFARDNWTLPEDRN